MSFSIQESIGAAAYPFFILDSSLNPIPSPSPTRAMAERNPQPRRVFLVPLPFQGHIIPMFELAELLHRRGFSITIFHTRLNYPDTNRHPHFHFIPIPDGLQDTHAPAVDLMALSKTINTNCVAPFRKLAASEGSEEPVAAVIVDAFFYSVREAAEEMGLRTLVLRTGSAACCNVFFALPLLWEKGYLPIRDSQLDVLVTELPPLRVRDLLNSGRSSSQEALCEFLGHATKGMKASSGLILNTFDALEGNEVKKIEQQTSIQVFPIGPLHKFSHHDSPSLLSRDSSCIEWLDLQAPRSVIYISFGSLAFMGKEEFVEVASGLSESHQSFLWVIRPDSVSGTDTLELPPGFEEETADRGKIIKWAPQQEVLAHPSVGGFWTHNGWNSTIESISEGIPMLCQPSFGDQMMNARYVCEAWKVGIMLDVLERGEICKAIRRLMTDEGKEMRARAAALKQNAISCLERGGSSSKALDKLVEHLLSS